MYFYRIQGTFEDTIANLCHSTLPKICNSYQAYDLIIGMS